MFVLKEMASIVSIRMLITGITKMMQFSEYWKSPTLPSHCAIFLPYVKHKLLYTLCMFHFIWEEETAKHINIIL